MTIRANMNKNAGSTRYNMMCVKAEPNLKLGQGGGLAFARLQVAWDTSESSEKMPPNTLGEPIRISARGMPCEAPATKGGLLI